MARLRAVVTIHAPGLGGWPSDGHLATATVNASWTASSAASMSPRKRIRVATQRPYSLRNTASTVTAREAMARTGPHGVGGPSTVPPQPGPAGKIRLGCLPHHVDSAVATS